TLVPLASNDLLCPRSSETIQPLRGQSILSKRPAWMLVISFARSSVEIMQPNCVTTSLPETFMPLKGSFDFLGGGSSRDLYTSTARLNSATSVILSPSKPYKPPSKDASRARLFNDSTESFSSSKS